MAESLATTGNAPGEAPARLIDLREVDTARRAVMWQGAACNAFPGLSLKLSSAVPQLGSINRYRMGAGELFAIESAPVEVSYRPPRDGALSPHLSLMVQSRGSTRISQCGRQCELAEGDICLVDESSGFRLVGEESSGILFLRLPRGAALSRHPQIERLYASVMPGSEPGTRMLADTLLRLLDDAAELAELQRAAMMNAVLQMLAVAGPFSAPTDTAGWRIRRALDFIELNLPVAGLTAEHVALDQHISRRRLDQLLRDATGKTIAAHLWDRRLERAAADLRDPRRSATSAAQIAFANGFEDAAHFNRAFRRRFAVTPGQWRLN
jgi:AraC family transcriptional activator of tynA and feaB